MYNIMISCCGIDCEKCDAYIATKNNDDSLREKTAKFWSKLNSAEITKDMINCEGCRADGVKTPFCSNWCLVKKCVAEKGYSTCAECALMENCATLGAMTANNDQLLVNLQNLK